MYNYINNFLLTKFYDSLPRFFSRKIFKILKIFFVPTPLKKLPDDNHPSKYDKNLQNIIIKKSKENDFQPFISYTKLLETLKKSGLGDLIKIDKDKKKSKTVTVEESK